MLVGTIWCPGGITSWFRSVVVGRALILAQLWAYGDLILTSLLSATHWMFGISCRHKRRAWQVFKIGENIQARLNSNKTLLDTALV